MRFELQIPFLALAVLELEKNPNPGPGRPDWVVLFGDERAGALWKRTPRAGGDPFLSGPVESPIFPGGRMEVAVFAAKAEDRKGEMDMTWRPQQENDRSGQASAPGESQPGTAAPADDDGIPF